MFSDRVGSLFMLYNHHTARRSDTGPLEINVENLSKSATALVVRLIFRGDPQLKTPLHDILQLFQDNYLDIRTFKIIQIARRSSENEPSEQLPET